MSEKILLAAIEDRHATPERMKQIAELAPQHRVVKTREREEIEGLLDQVEIAIGGVRAGQLERMPQLKWYQQFGTGVDWMIGHRGVIEHPFVLTNCSDQHCASLGDHVFALILAFSRNLGPLLRAADRREWAAPERYDDPAYFELQGKTLLLVGLGSIGQETAKRGAAFGLRMLGVRRNTAKKVLGVERIVPPEELKSVLPEADLVAVSLPHTPDTEHIFDAEAFAAMKRGSYFFNVGRGALVDEAALLQALRSGQLAGAGLDVFEKEPLPADSPLWEAPNLLITPHIGGCYNRIYQVWMDITLDNLQRWAAGRELRNVVDKRAGY